MIPAVPVCCPPAAGMANRSDDEGSITHAPCSMADVNQSPACSADSSEGSVVVASLSSVPSSASSTCSTEEVAPVPAKRAPLGSLVSVPPCRHNVWFRVRKMRGKWGVLLRCQVCSKSWPTKMELHEKCPEFYSGCCSKGGDCPSPHIYARGSVPAVQGGDAVAEDVVRPQQVPLRSLKDERRKAKKALKAVDAAHAESADSASQGTAEVTSEQHCSEQESAEGAAPVADAPIPVCCAAGSGVCGSAPLVGRPTPMFRYEPYSDVVVPVAVYY